VPGGYDEATLTALAPLGLPLEASAAAPPQRGMVCTLAYNHRAGARQALVTLAQAILAGDVPLALAATQQGPTTAFMNGTPRLVADLILTHARSIQRCADPAAGHKHLRAMQVLCAVRRGPWGAQTISEAVDRELASHARQESWYHGRIVLITANDRMRGLMNGDVGLCWRMGGDVRVVFARPAELVSFSTADLPAHEPAWALTIHKSQGSEYRHVHAVLPHTADHPLAMRELIYTAVTRASDAVTIWGTTDVFSKAVRTAHGRRSGLMEECLSPSASRPAAP
jgi:ATP-dependent exoDNAse (exonuclease V) alpha subunit